MVSPIIEEPVKIRNDQGGIATVTLNTDARQEYVASRLNVWGSYIEGIRSLPQSLDDITQDLGVDIYERMAFDPEIASLVNTLKAATLSQPIDIGPAIRDEADPDYKLSLEIHDHFERVFKNLSPSLNLVLDNMLDALFQGNKIAEKVYSEGTGDDIDKLVLTKLSVKHRSVIHFVVDRFGNNVGFMPSLVPGGLNGAASLGLSLLQPDRENVIPREKFAVLAFRPKDGDPRGTSLVRPAYNAWWLKMQIWPELLKYLAQFGGPSIIGFTSPDSRNTPSIGTDGVVTQETPEQVMLAQLELWRNGSAAAFPPGSSVNVIQAVGNGDAFLKTIDLLDRQISKAVTGQELATGEGQHQARSSSEVHQEILELVIAFIKKMVCDMIIDDVMKPSIEMNWGPDNLHLCPTASLGDVKKQDKAAVMASYIAGGYEIDPSQWIGVDEELNVPSRDPKTIQKVIDQKDKAAEAALIPKAPPLGQTNAKPTGNLPNPARGPSTTTRKVA